MISPGPWIEALVREVRAARSRPEPAHVHQLRVAAGRLAVFLRLARLQALRADLGWLRGSAARVRDLDVLLDAHGAEPWTGTFVRQREELAREFGEALASPRCAGLLQALEFLPELEEPRALERLPQLRRRVREAGQRAFGPAEPELDLLHRLRKRVRRLRYALEWLGRDAASAKALQDSLGDLRDRMLALRSARATAGAEPPALAELESASREAQVRSRAQWQAFRKAGECD
jgi:CHAD domain-containing protein